MRIHFGFIMKSFIPAFGAFLALFLGFAIADLSDIRWLGGLVLVVIGAIAGFFMFRLAGWGRTLISVGIVALAFIVSHPLGSLLGSYGSLLVVSLIAALLIYVLTPRRLVA
jgi:hypothetical protein